MAAASIRLREPRSMAAATGIELLLDRANQDDLHIDAG